MASPDQASPPSQLPTYSAIRCVSNKTSSTLQYSTRKPTFRISEPSFRSTLFDRNFNRIFLKHELVDLINRDYNDFVDLSINLVDVDHAVAHMRAPLSDLRDKIFAFRASVEESLVELQIGLRQRTEAANVREVLELLLDAFHVVSKIEKLIKELPGVPVDSSNGDVSASEKS